ncbi:MAG: hypothetical protein HY923_08315 [Elusimicrobia bacterium]|nr:hypothetical protein [Elusimicrobiota bacterium]
MTTVTIPFIVKSTNPLLTFVCLALVLAAFGYVAYLLGRHHHAKRKAKKLGHNHRHDGSHGNH